MRTIETLTTESAFVTGISYDSDTRELEVTIGDRSYIYVDFPPHLVGGFARVGSLGRYYNARVKGQYEVKP